MVNAINSAISREGGRHRGRARRPEGVQRADGQGARADIPVVGYNADAAGNNRLAYIGQDLFVSGQEMGKRIVDLVPSGDVALFIATPGSLNIQPRIDGAIDSIKKSGKPDQVPHDRHRRRGAEGALDDRRLLAVGHKDTKGMFAVDGGSTQAVAQVIKKYNLRDKDVKAGGYDLLDPTTQKLLAAGQIDFTIDQQPYLQGFLPVLELYLYQGVGDADRPRPTSTPA